MNSAVTLVRPPNMMARKAIVNVPTPPIALAYLAASLRRSGFPVRIVDGLGEGLDRFEPAHAAGLFYHGISNQDIVERIPPDSKVIGVQLAFSQNYVPAKLLIGLIRKRFPTALIVVGGEHVTALPEFTLEDCTEIDLACLRESDESLIEVCRAHQTGAGFGSIPGLAIRQGGKVVRTVARGRIREPDVLPLPAWDLVPLENYLSRALGSGPNFGRRMPIISSRGCPYQCTFCSSARMWSPLYISRKPQSVVDEIRDYVRTYRLDAIEIIDLTMAVNRKWFREFLGLMKQADLGIRWSIPAGTRSEILDEEILTLMQETGCAYFALAPESGSLRTLEKIKKRISLPHMKEALRIGARTGMTARINIVIGFPFETRADVFATLRLVLVCAWLGAEDCGVNIYRAYPGTEMFDELVEDGQIAISYATFDDLNFSWDIFSLRRRTYCRHIPSTELKIYRFGIMLSFYLFSYLLRPRQILRSLSNLITRTRSATLFEERLGETIRRVFG